VTKNELFVSARPHAKKVAILTTAAAAPASHHSAAAMQARRLKAENVEVFAVGFTHNVRLFAHN